MPEIIPVTPGENNYVTLAIVCVVYRVSATDVQGPWIFQFGSLD